MEAVTRRAKAAISYAAKNNPLPVQQAVLKPRIAMKDLVSSAKHLPARTVSAMAANVQDVNKVWETVKATVIKPGTSVVQEVGAQAVTDFANSQVPGLGDVLGLLGPSRKRGDGAAREAGDRAHDVVGRSSQRGPPGGETETFYRGMSRGEYDNQLKAKNSLYPLHGETFVTQERAYIEQLAARHPGDYEVLVRFDMEPGTRDALFAAGGRDDPASRAIASMGLDYLPVLAKGKVGRKQVHVKAELGWLNFGLRRGSVDIFNQRMTGFQIVKEF